MRSSAERSEPVGSESRAHAAGCVVRPLHAGPLARVTAWRCTATPRDEKAQAGFCLSFVHAGAYRLRHRDGDRLVDAAAWVLMAPAAPYTTTHPLGCCDHGSAVVLRDDVARAVLARAGRRADGAVLHDPAPSPSGAAFARQARLVRALRDGTLDELAADEAALAVFESALRDAAPERCVEPRDRERVEAVRESLQRRMAERPTLDELAALAGVTPEHLCRRFRAATGSSIGGYLARLRLRAALARLADEPGVDLAALALDVGFSSHSHFTAAFRREFGAAPTRLAWPAAADRRDAAAALARDARTRRARTRPA